jgi:hypothetical protein
MQRGQPRRRVSGAEDVRGRHVYDAGVQLGVADRQLSCGAGVL